MIALTLLLGLGLAQEDAAPLLLEVPAGWRHERLDLPPSFAPDLAFRGIEDLSFAPGMFERGSDSYFSYALALRLEGDVNVDERMLTGFLESYYRGLYSAVAAEKDFDNDVSAIHARVRRDGAEFRATVSTFDPFTDGAALELDLELSVHAGPRATELLGLASPRAASAPIWEQLHALARAWRSARPAPVFLNHAFAVVDAETYAALQHSSFLRETFALTEERTTKRADVSYSGLYVYGRRTYFEFLLPQDAAGLAPGDTGLALGVESAGGLEELSRRLGLGDLQAQIIPITRELDGQAIPWFRLLGMDMPPAPLRVFAMEYEPRFLATWHADLPPSPAGLARIDVLERYAASLGRRELHAEAPFADVGAVHLALSDEQRETLLLLCAAAGFEIEEGAGVWTCFGPQFRVVVRPSLEPGGVTGLELALRRPWAQEPLQLGRASLRFSGDTATLALRP